MSWAKLETRRRAWGRIQAVSVRIAAKGYAGPRLIMRIARPLAQAAGLSLAKVSRVDVLIGGAKVPPADPGPETNARAW
jgi:hypothetical protein